MHVCAWCDREIDTHPGHLAGQPATNYGMCARCLRSRLADLKRGMAVRDLARARRMHRSGQTLAYIGDLLGVSQPALRAVLEAA